MGLKVVPTMEPFITGLSLSSVQWCVQQYCIKELRVCPRQKYYLVYTWNAMSSRTGQKSAMNEHIRPHQILWCLVWPSVNQNIKPILAQYYVTGAHMPEFLYSGSRGRKQNNAQCTISNAQCSTIAILNGTHSNA